jgi:hypothetical protein
VCRVLASGLGASRSVEFLGESDEKPFRPADVAEPIGVLIPDYAAHELCPALAKPAKRLVDIVKGDTKSHRSSSPMHVNECVRDLAPVQNYRYLDLRIGGL